MAVPDRCEECGAMFTPEWKSVLRMTSFKQYSCWECLKKFFDKAERLRVCRQTLQIDMFDRVKKDMEEVGYFYTPKTPVFKIVLACSIKIISLESENFEQCEKVLFILCNEFEGIDFYDLRSKEDDLVYKVTYKRPITPNYMFQLKISTGPIWICLYTDDKDNAVTMANILFEDFDGAQHIQVLEKATGGKIFERKR